MVPAGSPAEWPLTFAPSRWGTRETRPSFPLPGTACTGTMMPKYEGIVSQEGMWAIRSWIETVHVD